jgi:hypothetical protein
MYKYHSTALFQTHNQGQVWYQYHSQDRTVDMKILVQKSLTIHKTEKKNCKINWRTKQAVAVGHFLPSRPTLGWTWPVHWRRFSSPETRDHSPHEGSAEKWGYLHTHTYSAFCMLVTVNRCTGACSSSSSTSSHCFLLHRVFYRQLTFLKVY